MNKVWIFLLVVHGCATEHVATRAYNTEIECNQAIDRSRALGGYFTEVRAQCESADALLEESKTKHD